MLHKENQNQNQKLFLGQSEKKQEGKKER